MSRNSENDTRVNGDCGEYMAVGEEEKIIAIHNRISKKDTSMKGVKPSELK